jgi:hypothetical protein
MAVVGQVELLFGKSSFHLELLLALNINVIYYMFRINLSKLSCLTLFFKHHNNH